MALVTQKSISVVFPAYNEEENVAGAIQQANEYLKDLTNDWEIIVVNDGSVDGTRAAIDSIAAQDPRVVPVHHEGGNRGYGAALRSGIERARKDLLFFSDSDLQFHLAELPLLLLWIEQHDVVIGYREKRNDLFYRRMNAFGWNLLVRAVLGLRVRDIDCAFKLFRTSVFEHIRIDAVGAMVNTDILVQAVRLGFKIKEVPVTHFARIKGRPTGAKLRVIVKAFKELVRLSAKLRNVKQVASYRDRRVRRSAMGASFVQQRGPDRRQVYLPINFTDRRQRHLDPPGGVATAKDPEAIVGDAAADEG
jgi:glycosyltransferase involved in cell wall biosynthesis